MNAYNWWRRLMARWYDPCVLCWRRARPGGFLLCDHCAQKARPLS